MKDMKETRQAKASVAIKVNKNIALFIWSCHVAVAWIFYYKGIYYALNAYYWASGLILLGSLPYLVSAIRNKFVPYEGIYIFMAGLVVGFTAYIFLPLNRIELNHESLNYAMKVAFFGTASFLVGYWSIFGSAIANILPLKRFIVLNENLPKLPLKFYLIGWAFRFFPFLSSIGIDFFEKSGIMGTPLKLLAYTQRWEISNMLTTYGICAGLMIDTYLFLSKPEVGVKIRHKKKIISRLSFFLFLELVYGFLSGMAGNVIRPVILVFLVYARAKKKIPIVPIAITMVFFIFFIVPFIKTFREKYWAGYDVHTSVTYAAETLSNEGILSNKRYETIKRLSNPLEMAALCYEARMRGSMVLTYKDLPEYVSRFVPRFLWPWKPMVDYNEIGRQIGLLSPDDFHTSVSLTLVGGLIMDNGLAGVLVGMFFIGLIIRTLWDWLVMRAEGSVSAFIIYLILIYRCISPEDFYAFLHATLSFIIYAYILMRFVNRRHYRRIPVEDK